MRPDSWIVGVELEDGEYSTLQDGTGGGINPSMLVAAHIPISFPWEDELQIREAPVQEVEVTERSMGPETHYSARREGSVPNSNQSWEIEVEVWEYPPKAFNTAALSHSDQIRNAELDPEDLLSIIS